MDNFYSTCSTLISPPSESIRTSISRGLSVAWDVLCAPVFEFGTGVLNGFVDDPPAHPAPKKRREAMMSVYFIRECDVVSFQVLMLLV